MNREGPPLQVLLHRLAESPADFLAEPRIGNRGEVHVGAVVADLAAMLGADGGEHELARFDPQSADADRGRLSVVLLLCWLYAHEWFRPPAAGATDLVQALDQAARDVDARLGAKRFVADPERREELVRTALARLDARPAGETPAQAQDRLTSLSAVERARVIKAAREAEKRARAIREALARKAAEESADKWTRE